MTTTLTGNNSYAISQRLGELTAKFVAKNGDLALERIDAEETDAASVIYAVSSLPFLSEYKMVVLRNPGSNKQIAEQIEQIINAAGSNTELIIYEPLPDKRTSYYKSLKAKTQLEEFSELDSQALAKWLVEEAKKTQASLNLADAKFLVERVGNNQQLLANELQKLRTYNPQITRSNIELLSEPTSQSKIFDLLDAAFSGNKKRALKLYEEQRAQKVEPQAILAMIAWQLQLLALTQFGKSKQPATIAKDAGMNPYPVIKAARLSSKLSPDKLKAMIDEAFKIDLQSKTSGLELDEALKTYIVIL